VPDMAISPVQILRPLAIVCGVWVMGCQSALSANSDTALAQARAQLGSESKDSDAAVILSQALSETENATPDRQSS